MDGGPLDTTAVRSAAIRDELNLPNSAFRDMERDGERREKKRRERRKRHEQERQNIMEASRGERSEEQWSGEENKDVEWRGRGDERRNREKRKRKKEGEERRRDEERIQRKRRKEGGGKTTGVFSSNGVVSSDIAAP